MQNSLMGSRAFHASAPMNGIDFRSPFVAQIDFLPSKSHSKLMISPWLSSTLMSSCIFLRRLTIHASDSQFGVTALITNLINNNNHHHWDVTTHQVSCNLFFNPNQRCEAQTDISNS